MSKEEGRIYLSPPNTDQEELKYLASALESGWVAPVGPMLNRFEEELVSYFPSKAVLAVNSGTSALHLSLVLAGVEKGDHVIVSSFTFAACANVILYQGAIPVFLDSEEDSWNLDPELLANYLKGVDLKPKALIVTHLYGVPAKTDQIIKVARAFDVTIIEDAAEALGAKVDQRFVGGIGDYGILSFNGNKIITTSGGGALICPPEQYQRALHLATQANSGTYGYQHLEVGFNYRMSNLLAAVGVSQLNKLRQFIQRKQAINAKYVKALQMYFDFPEWRTERCNYWLTVALAKAEGTDVLKLLQFLDEEKIEARQVWKPLHLHPAYSTHSFVGAGVCERLYSKGICLPSGTGMTESAQDRVIAVVRDFFEA